MRKHLKKKEITVFGHQKLVQKGIQPRKKKQRSKKHDVGVALFDPDDDDDMKNLITMDLPGRFPTTSASGNKYIFVIKFTPMTSQTKEEMVRCFKLCHNEFKEADFTAQLLKLNNEVLK